ncbi:MULTISPECIES: universal stress protein [Burkholderia]|uniref:universal stress protein n=1 Tax=Burkholderia TaxID=32008 RepID=UPI001CF0FF78|nr:MULTISPECIES: universal stress protein [Burkholderia]MDO5941457.1 universal stress protein [Burkholderia cepacia]
MNIGISPVQAVRAPQRVLIAVDGSEIALDALRTGLTFSRADTEFRAIYVVDPPQCWATSSLAGHWKKH